MVNNKQVTFFYGLGLGSTDKPKNPFTIELNSRIMHMYLIQIDVSKSYENTIRSWIS